MSDKPLILIIDDEINNINLLKLELKDLYDIISVEDGVKGWELLQKNKDKVKTILLDRMMPNMNGIEFMKKLKSDDSVSTIPVIMQTAAAEKAQLVEGIEAGAYYYLTKPYDDEIMRSIVSAAVNDYAQYSQLKSELKTFRKKTHLVKDSNFKVKTIDDAYYLSTFIANFFPDPERVILGISELIINAIEHGNCGISYDEKTQLNRNEKWREEVDRRIADPKNANKTVDVKYSNNGKEIVLKIKDQGNGFDWSEYMNISSDRATDSHGRGIAMSKVMSFDEIEYIGNGNEVCCKVYLNKQSGKH